MQQRIPREAAEACEDRVGGRAVVADTYTSIAGRGQVLRQRQAYMLPVVAPITSHQHQVGLLDFAGTHLRMQVRQRTTLLCQEQYAGGVAVESMNQFQETQVRSLRA